MTSRPRYSPIVQLEQLLGLFFLAVRLQPEGLGVELQDLLEVVARPVLEERGRVLSWGHCWYWRSALAAGSVAVGGSTAPGLDAQMFPLAWPNNVWHSLLRPVAKSTERTGDRVTRLPAARLGNNATLRNYRSLRARRKSARRVSRKSACEGDIFEFRTLEGGGAGAWPALPPSNFFPK